MDKQVAQLLLQVDANVAVAQREIQNLARVVKQSSGDMNSSIDSTVRAHGRLHGAIGNARIAQMELSHVVTASSDAYAAGASPVRILTMEMGRLAQAASFLGGGGTGVMGKLGAFMAGPWGIAVLVGVTALSQLIAKHHEAGDSVDSLIAKMKAQAEQAERQQQAEKAWAQSLDGAEQAIRDVNKALDDLEGKEKSSAERQLDAANKALAVASAHRAAAAALIERAKAEYELQKAMASGPGQRGEIATLGLDNKLGGLDAAQNDLANTDKAIASAQAAIQRAQSFVTVEHAAASAAEQINRKYAELEEATRKQYLAQHKVGDELDRQIRLLEKKKQLELDALKTEHKGSGEFGKQIGFGDAEAIAKAAGLTVTSGYRSSAKQAELYNTVRTAANPVARPGTSAHEGANGKWALDIAFAPGLTAEKLKKLYGDQGVSLSAVYKETGHFHIEGSRSRAAAEEAAAARAAQKAKVDDDMFARESAQLDAEILSAKRQLVGGFDTQAKLADDEIDAQKTAQLAAVQKQVDAKQISEAEAKILRAKVGELADTKKAAVDEQAYRQAAEQLLRAVEQQRGFQIDDLRFADDMATSQAEHRQLQLQILDIQYQQKKAELEYQLMLIKRNKDFATSPALQADAANVQGQIDRLPTQQSEDRQRVERGTMDPLHAWMQQVPHDAATIREALQSIEVQGFDNLASSITDVITGTKSLGAAFKNIANQIIGDIIQMTIKMLIFRAISSIFGGGFGGGVGGATNFSSSFGAVGGTPHFAGGGSFTVGGNGGLDNNVMSINGQRVAMVNKGETVAVIPKASRMSLGGGGGAQQIHLVIETAPSDDAWGKVSSISATHIGHAAPVIITTAVKETFRQSQRPALGGGR